MKKYWCRSIATIAAGFSLTSCYDIKKMYDALGYLPVQGLPYAGEPIGGCLMVRDTAAGRLVTNFSVDDLPGRAALYSGGIDGGSLGRNYTRQFPLRLGAQYADIKVRDIGTDGGRNSVGVGTEGSIFAFGGEECFEAIDPITSEDLNTVIYSPILGTWLAAGNNGTLLRSDDRLSWSTVPLSNLPANTDFKDSANYSQGALLVSDGRITELTPGMGGEIAVSYGIGFDKNFKVAAAWENHYMALAEDTKTGGSVVLERTNTGFNFAPQFSSIFGSKYREFFAYGDYGYFFREDEDLVEIRNYNDIQDITTRQLPLSVDDYYALNDKIYIAGRNRWDERQIWSANLDFSIMTPITEEPQDKLMKTGQCLDDGSGPSWSIHGDDLDMAQPGIQYHRYRGNEKGVYTIGGTTGTGRVCDSVRLSPKLSLGVGWLGSNPLFFADSGHESFKLAGNGLQGPLHGIQYDSSTGTSLVTNDAGEVFSSDLSGASTRSALDDLQWNKETLPWKLSAKYTFGRGEFYYKIDEDEVTEDHIGYRDTGGNWSGFKINFSDKINDLYYDTRLETLMVATPDGLGYWRGNDQQGLFPIQIGQKTNIEYHQVLGDGRGDRVHFVAGIAGDTDGPCMVGELGFGGVLSMNPSVEIIDYTAPSRSPRMIESAGFFGCLGNRSLFSLYPRRYENWPDYAEQFFGDRNLTPDGDHDSNGITNLDQAIGGARGLQPRIAHMGIHARIEIPINPFFQGHKIKQESSSDLRSFQPYDPFLTAPLPTGGYEIIEPLKDAGPTDNSDYFQFTIQRTF